MKKKKNKSTQSIKQKNLTTLKKGIIALFKGASSPLNYKDI